MILLFFLLQELKVCTISLLFLFGCKGIFLEVHPTVVCGEQFDGPS